MIALSATSQRFVTDKLGSGDTAAMLRGSPFCGVELRQYRYHATRPKAMYSLPLRQRRSGSG